MTGPKRRAPADPLSRIEEGIKHVESRLGLIDHKVDSMGQTQAFALRMNRDEMEAVVKNIFKNAKRKAQVYLAANNRRSVNDIADHLGMQRQNVGTILAALREEDILGVYPEGGRDIWYKLPVDKTIGITKLLMEQYDVDRDGLAKGKKPKKK